MSNFKRFFIHLNTIRKHKKIVFKWAKKMGIGWQGLVHDLSKYTPEEFIIYKFATGKKSPHDSVRELTGMSETWIYHKNRNKHHWEFWVTNKDLKQQAVKIPYNYIIEMVCDMVSTGKVYLKDKWTTASALEYYQTKAAGNRIMYTASELLLIYLLTKLSKCKTEKEFFKWYRGSKRYIKQSYKNVE